MSFDNKSKSILLQVAFKAAVEVEKEIALVEEKTQVFFEQLLALHEKYGIDNQSTSSGGGGSTSAPETPDAPVIEINGENWLDYRGLKDLGAVVAAFPDFKTPDAKKSVWLTKKDGSPTKFAIDNPTLISA